jgi:hypothetical protein
MTDTRPTFPPFPSNVPQVDAVTITGIRGIMIALSITDEDLYDDMYDAVRNMMPDGDRSELEKIGELGHMVADMINAMLSNPGHDMLVLDFDICPKCGHDIDEHTEFPDGCTDDDDE